jgi:hypothetical protein
MTPWYSIAMGGAAFLAAAKAHGRQLRLERELAGFWRVVFGGRNPPFVTALWKRDRILLWIAAAAGLILLSAYAVLAVRLQWRIPLMDGMGRLCGWGLVTVAGLWSISIGFFTAGFAGLFRSVAAYRKGEPQVREWCQRAFWGCVGWWSLATALLAASVALAFVVGP